MFASLLVQISSALINPAANQTISSILYARILDRHLVAGCSTRHKPCLLHVSGWDMDHNLKYTLNKCFPKMVSVSSGFQVLISLLLILASFQDSGRKWGPSIFIYGLWFNSRGNLRSLFFQNRSWAQKVGIPHHQGSFHCGTICI